MPFLGSARNYAAFGLAIPSYVRNGTDLTVDKARAQIRVRLQTREQRFLKMVELCVFGNAASPYLPLLKAAGCELGDIGTLVQKDGLVSTLARLRREGVFFTFEEFKGRERVERTGVSFEARPDDFANPKSNRHVSTRTTGSTGKPSKTWTSLEDRETWLPNLLTAPCRARTRRGTFGLVLAGRTFFSRLQSGLLKDWPASSMVRPSRTPQS